MVEAPPAQAPALEDPVGFGALSDDLVIRALVRSATFEDCVLVQAPERYRRPTRCRFARPSIASVCASCETGG